MAPIVSVIVPNYNHAKFLRQRIDSILWQTYTDFELILLDDCSTDESLDVLMSYKDNPHVSAIIINEKNTGSPFEQWVKGIKKAKGKYIWIAESDDYAAPNFLKETTSLLDQNPEASICLTGSWVVNEYNKNIDELYKHVDPWNIDNKAHIFNSTEYIVNYMSAGNTIYNGSMVLFRREGCLDNINFKFTDMRYAGDWLFWIEQIKKGKYVIEFHQKLNFWRKHTYNTTIQGFNNFNSLPEIAYIIDFLCKTTLKGKLFHQFISKNFLYRWTKKQGGLTQERRNELYDLIRKQNGVRYYHYIIGHWFREYKKHILLKSRK